MGNKLAVSANQPLEQYLYEQPSLTYDGTIGKGRFLKTIKCLHPEGPVVVKIFVKEDKSDSLSRQIERARVALTGIVLLLLSTTTPILSTERSMLNRDSIRFVLACV